MICINSDKFLLALASSRMSDTALSTKANVSRTLISQLKNGKKDTVRPVIAGKIANALEVKVEDLI